MASSPLRFAPDDTTKSRMLVADQLSAAEREQAQNGADSQFERGLRAGAAGMSAGAFDREALAGELSGDPNWQQKRAVAHQMGELAGEVGPRVSSLRDVRGVGDAADWAAGAFGQGLVSMAPVVATAFAARVPGARGLLAKALPYASAAVPAYMLEKGEAVHGQYEDPALAAATAQDRDRVATYKGMANAVLEAAVPAGLANSFLRKPATSLLGTIGRSALAEGATEAAQEYVGYRAEKALDPNRQLDPWRIADAAAMGAVTGGGVSAATRGPAHGAQALADRFARGREAAPMQEQGPAAEPPMDAAPPGTPLPPAPDDGSGGGVGGLFDTLNERFGPGLRERAHKTKDYVSDTIDRMGEAVKTAQTPEEFLRQVFRSSPEDAAAADLLHDTEDPGVMSAADPAAALQQRDAERQERAAFFAEELLNDPATPDAVKERVASFGGDFTDPEARAFVARNLVAQRAGEKLVRAVNGLIDLSKDFGGRAAEVGTDLAANARGMIDKGMSAAADRIVKKNLQGGDEPGSGIAQFPTHRTRRTDRQQDKDFVESEFAAVVANQEKAVAEAEARVERAKRLNTGRMAEIVAVARTMPPEVFEDNPVYENMTPLERRAFHSITEADEELAFERSILNDMRKSLEPAKASSTTDRIVKKNLQGISLVDAKPLVDVLAQRLGPSGAAKAPELARQLLALSVRMSPETRITPEVDSRLRSLSDAIDDNVLDMVTEVSGSDGLRQALARIREIPSAQTDVATSDGSSFLESMLVRPLADGQRKQLATVIDEAGLQLKDLNPTRRNQLLTGLAAAFGSKENAQTVVEFYGNLRREAMRRMAESGSDPDDLPYQPDEDVAYEAPRPTGDAYEGTDDVAEYGTLPERDAPVQDTYYADAKSMRPFYEGREGRLSTEGGTRRRVRDIGAFMDRMQGRGVELRSQRYGDFLKERNEDSAEAVKRIRKDLEKRISEAAPRKGEAAEYAEGRTKNRQYLEEQLLALNLIDKADGPEAAANLFSVARAVGERNELGITDAQLAEADTLLRRTVDPKKPPPGMTRRQAEKHNRDIAKTKIVFRRAGDGAQPLALSAESLWKAYAKGQPAGRPMHQLFADAVSAVLNRPDIADLAHGLDGVLIDRESGTYADPQMPDDVREVKKELAHEYEARLNEAEGRVKGAASDIEDARDEDRADGGFVERIEEAADGLQREADTGRVVATTLKDEAKSIKWEDGAPSPEAIELRARAAWEYDISRVFAEGARDLRETAMEVRIELERVEGGERGAAAKVRNYDEFTGAALHPDDKPSPAKPKGLGKRLDAALLANPELLEVLDAWGQPKDKGMTESRMRENLFDAYSAIKTTALKARIEGLRAKYQEAKNASNAGTPAAREAAKQEAATLKEIGQMVRWILEQREEGRTDTESAPKRDDAMARLAGHRVDTPQPPRRAAPAMPKRVILPKTSRYAAKDQVKSDRANKFIGRGAPGSSTAAYAEAWGSRANVGEYSPEDAVFISVNGNRPGALTPPWPEIKRAMSAGATLITDVPADRNRSFNTGERAVAAFLGDNGYFEASPGTWVREKTSQGKVVKKSFVGAKADPEGASKAGFALGVGEEAEMVWALHGWFRGPDGKMRKEIRSPVLRAHVRAIAKHIVNAPPNERIMSARRLFEGVPGFERLLGDLDEFGILMSDFKELGSFGGAMKGRLLVVSVGAAVEAAIVGTVPVEPVFSLVEKGVLPTSPFSPDFVPALRKAITEGKIPGLTAEAFEDAVIAEMEKTIHHELQHILQKIEGFESGGNPLMAIVSKYGDIDALSDAFNKGHHYEVEEIMDRAREAMLVDIGPDADPDEVAHELYRDLIGEVEASDVEERFNLSDEEARRILPDLMSPNREFLRAVRTEINVARLRVGLKRSAMGGRPGRPGKNWGDKDAVKAEILRLRGKDVKVKVEKLVKQLGGSGQYTYDPATGERLIEVAVNATSPVGTARHEAMHDLFRFLSENDATRSVAKDLRDATSAPHVIRQLRDLLKNDKAALEQLNDPEERAAYAYQFWAEGLLQIGPTGTGIFHTIRQFIKDLFGIVTAGQRGEDLLRAFHDGKFADPSIVQEVLQDINDSSGDRVANKLNRAAPALTRALNSLLSAAPKRLRRFENDHLNKLADKFQPENGTGFVQNKFQQEGVWTNRLGGILRGTTAVERREAIDQLQAMKPTSKLAKELAKFNEDIYEYMRDAGVQSWDSTTKKFVPLRKVQGYFTRSWDPDAIAGNRAEFEALLRKEGRVSAADAAMIAGNLARGTEARPGPKESPVDLGFMPYAPHTSERVLTFINPGNADKFAKFQRKDLADIMMSYVRGSTHRAEYAREFGNNGEKIVDLVAKSGIKDPKELGEISNAVQALEGSLDPGNWSVQTKEAMSAVLTLQNVTLLPLAIVSQMIDPIVLAARTGDIKDAGTAYVTALKRLKNTITKSKNKVPGEELAEILGVVSEDSTLQAMAMAYGTTRMSKRMENINRVFFKYNGMQGWNNSMRIAATAAGERYLLAHRKDAKALAELGLEPKDIKSTGGKLDVSSPKVQQAMFQFVDQAVLRPSAANRPVWMSDPRFLLVAHLKQFTFAMHNVVLKRANRELQNDNPKPWGVLMLAMPVILAADMAKFALTGYAPAGWGFKYYVLHAVARSGILGLGDFSVQAMDRVDSGKMPGEGLLGPTFENLMEILRWIGGDPRTDFGDVVDRTVPGARFI